MVEHTGPAARRWAGYGLLAILLSVVSDGWSSRPSPLLHQMLLVPFTAAFALILFQLLLPEQDGPRSGRPGLELPWWWFGLLIAFQSLSMFMMFAEAHHFKMFGYNLQFGSCMLAFCVSTVSWALFGVTRRGPVLFLAVMLTYLAGLVVAIRCFPLNYLRSDMLPVISWADERLLRHLDPYGTMHVGTRLYDFPYLPGVLVAFLPAQALHCDLRFATLFYLVSTAALIFLCSRPCRRFEVAALLGVFLLCPFLQYRHDLYLEPHWFTLALAIVLMHRRHLRWAAVVWGMSCGVYQLSWVMLPFFLLYGLRRCGVWEACKLTLLTLLGAVFITGPFLESASHQVARNTVGQWSHLPHAIADPINVSFWLTYLIRPDQLKWVQAFVMTALFTYCFFSRRCSTIVDTLRWMVCSLAVFIPLNVLVDGYFYLTLLLLLLLYVCLANDWWSKPIAEPVELHP